MKYMNRLKVKDLDALEDLGDLTWDWGLRYGTEPTLEHGRFYFSAVHTGTKIRYLFDGYTIKECVDQFKDMVKKIEEPEYNNKDSTD